MSKKHTVPDGEETPVLEPASTGTLRKPMLGEIVIFHSGHYGHTNFPALIQEVFPDGSVRLYIFSRMSTYQQVALYGTGADRWSYREDPQEPVPEPKMLPEF